MEQKALLDNPAEEGAGVAPHYAYRPSPASARRVDAAARRILETVGVRVDNDDVLDRLGKSGAEVDSPERRVRFSPAWVDDHVGKAHNSFVMHSRDGANDMHVGAGRVHFVNGGRVFRILDMTTGGYRPTMLRDVTNTASLVNSLGNIDGYVIACQAYDAPSELYHLNDFFHALNHTTKHVMGGVGDVEGAKQVLKLASIVAGGEAVFQERPFLSIITNPVSPLSFDSDTLQILDFCCSRGVPVTCAPAPIAGATGPATLAGTLAQMHAEALAGVALTQVLAPSSKILYGAVPTAMDLRTMEFTMGSVEGALMSGFAVSLAKLYDLPIYASAGVTEAKRPDIQSGVEKSFSILGTALAGADYIHLAAGMLDSGNSISYEQYVIDDEIIGMARRLLSGFTADDECLAVDVVSSVGPGGNYVTEMHTIDHMMDEFFYPELAVRSNFDIWEEKGRPDMLSRATDRVRDILSANTEGLLDRAVIDELERECPGIIGM